MAKRFKLRISRVIPSFQSCKSKDPASMPENPLPVIFRLSPVNPKAIDIDFPATIPEPTKHHSSSLKRHVTSAIVSVGCSCRSKPSRHDIDYSNDDDFPAKDPSGFRWKKEEKWHVVARVPDPTPRRKICSSVSGDSDDEYFPRPAAEKKKTKKQRKKKTKSKQRIRISTSSADSGWFSSEGEDCEREEDDETETLVSSRSFSSDSSSDFNPHLKPIHESPRRKKKALKKRIKKVKPAVVAKSKTKLLCPSPETDSPARVSVFRRLIPCSVDGKVRESFAVVKRSEDPYGDFRSSMLEMILEKKMFEARDLEQLLHCFLSLNSQAHHGVIVEAFSEIWEVLFCKSNTAFVAEAR